MTDILGPTVVVTIADGDLVSIFATATYGSDLLPAAGLNLSISYIDGVDLIPVIEYTNLAVQAETTSVFTLSALASGLGAGTYTFVISGSSVDTGWVGGTGTILAMVLRT